MADALMGNSWYVQEVFHLFCVGLPVDFRIKYKIRLMMFNSLHGHGPEYISEMLIPRILHYGLRSQDDLTLVVPRIKRKTLGDRAFGI